MKEHEFRLKLIWLTWLDDNRFVFYEDENATSVTSKAFVDKFFPTFRGEEYITMRVSDETDCLARRFDFAYYGDGSVAVLKAADALYFVTKQLGDWMKVVGECKEEHGMGKVYITVTALRPRDFCHKKLEKKHHRKMFKLTLWNRFVLFVEPILARIFQ